MTHKLPDLDYGYDSLEPFIDAKTMEIHHTKHHQTYVDKLNTALEDYEELKTKTHEELIKELNSIPDEIKDAVRNNGGGHLNHCFFWILLKKDVNISGEISDAINENFGSFDLFKEKFKEAATTQFGSGWAWLVVNPQNENKLEIVKTANQDNPMTENKIPILGIDVWEHAYYLKYQNKRPDYVNAFFNVINWEKVNENFKLSNKQGGQNG